MKVSRRGFLKALGQVAVGGSLAAIGGHQYITRIEPEWLALERVQVPVKNLKPGLEGFKIVQLSDLHLHPFTQLGLIQKAVALANSLQPDLITLTGDYVSRDAESIFELAPVLASLQAKYGTFAVLGNHDLWTDGAIVRAGLDEVRLPVLQNQGMTLGVGRETIYLAGLDDVWVGTPNLNSALAGLTSAETPVILLAHEPDFADTAASVGPVSLQLSGHSHGGQVRLPGYGALILPYLGRKYDQGLHKVDNMWIYTSRGIGVVYPPIRFNCPPEVTEITLIGA
jgi:predicted MPP superfamily phosphohydrolase